MSSFARRLGQQARRTVQRPATIWQECEQMLADLGLPARYDLTSLRSRIEQRRGRPLRILPKPADIVGGPCGLWLSTDREDVVFVEPATSNLHYQHILLHELGHLLYGHGVLVDSGNHVVSSLLPDLDPANVRMVLAREQYEDRQEQEAETFATLLLAGWVWGSGDGERPDSLWHAMANS